MGIHIQNRKKGFTLAELLVVVAIVAILAAISGIRIYQPVPKNLDIFLKNLYDNKELKMKGSEEEEYT